MTTDSPIRLWFSDRVHRVPHRIAADRAKPKTESRQIRGRIMKTCLIGLCLLAVIFSNTGVAGAEDLDTGFLGMKWTSPASQHEGLSRLYITGNLAYYTQPNIVNTIRDIPVPDVVYGFYQGKLFAVYIRVQSEEVFGEFRKYLKSKYGVPDTTVSTKTDESVYKWKHGDIKIKLKTNAESHRMKLSFYYRPLSDLVNEEQAEDLYEKSVQVLPIDKNAQPEMIPLLHF